MDNWGGAFRIKVRNSTRMFSLGFWGMPRRRGGGKKKAQKTPKATWFDE